MTSYPTTLLVRHMQRLRRQETIAESRAPEPTDRPVPTSIRSNLLGPLTTAFDPPAHCSRAALVFAPYFSARQGQLCKTQLNGQKYEDDTKCWPTATAYPSKAPQAPLGGLGFYSPGIICPTGYATACTLRPSQTNAPEFQFPLEAQETGIGCCPTGYSCGSVSGSQACTQVAISTTIDAMTCDGNSMQPVDAFAIPFSRNSATITSLKLYAPMIQLVHQSTDLPEYQTPSSAIATFTFTSTPTPSSTALPSQPKTAYFSKSNKLSTTEIAGIIAACLILLLCLLSIAAYMVLRKRRPAIFSSSPSRPRTTRQSSSTSTLTSLTAPKDHPMNGYYPPIDPSPPHNPISTYQFGLPPNPTLPNTNTDEYDLIDLNTPVAPRLGNPSTTQDDMESPIDGTSPFRLKRGTTIKSLLKRGHTLIRATSSRSRRTERHRSVSPLGQDEGDVDEWESDAIGEGRMLDRNVSAMTQPEPRGRKVGVVVSKSVPETVVEAGRLSHVGNISVAGVAL